MPPIDRGRQGFAAFPRHRWRLPPRLLGLLMLPSGRPPEPSASSSSPPACEADASAVCHAIARLSASTIRRLHRVSSSRSPPSVLRSVRPLPASTEALTIGPLVPPRESRSVRVVSLHLDGFLRSDGASTVAARSRPWGSSCFARPAACPCDSRESHRSARPISFPTMHSPREDSPHQQRGFSLTAPSEDGAFTRGRSLHAVSREAPLPRRLARRLRATQWRLLPSCSTSRCCSADRSVTAVHRCQ